MKKAYLTIDDAPSKDFKKKVDFLISKKIPAIIFCEGQYINGREKELIYAIEEGFILGNHSYSHPHFSELSLKECTKEIKLTDGLIKNVYKKSKIKRPIKIFRFPYGDKGTGNKKGFLFRFFSNKSKKIQSYLKKEGYKQPSFESITYQWYKKYKLDKELDTFWTFDTKEYQIGKEKYNQNTIQKIVKRIDDGKKLNSDSNEIILIHDHENTTKYFNLLINTFLEKDIEFIKPKLN